MKQTILTALIVITLSLAATGCITYNEANDVIDPEAVHVTQTPEPTPMVAATPTATAIPKVTTTPVQTPTNTAPKATPTTAPIKIGTYENPVPIGESFLSDTGALQITVTKVERGNHVYDYIANENMFNDEPAPGNEYMVVKIKFEYLFGDYEFKLSGHDFYAYANNIECKTPFLVMPDRYPEMGSIGLMPGGTVEKWIVFEVPKDEQVTIAYKRLFVMVEYYFDAGSGDYS